MKHRLSEDERARLLEDYTDGEGTSQAALGVLYGISQNTVSRYVKGLVPTHPKRKRYADADRERARELRAAGTPWSKIAKDIGCAESVARKWCEA
jgi:transposase-like protein